MDQLSQRILLGASGGAEPIYWDTTIQSGINFFISSTVNAQRNSYLVGTTSQAGGFGGNDIFIAKIDVDGFLQWQKGYGLSFNEEGNGAAVDSQNNLIVAARFASSGVARAVVLKIDPQGTILLQQEVRSSNWPTFDNGPIALDIAVDGQDNIYLLGQISNFGIPLLVMKLTTNGALLWQRWVDVGGSTDTTFRKRITVDTANNVLVTGTTRLAGNNDRRGWVFKLNGSNGSTSWSRVFSTTSDNRFPFTTFITTDASNAVYVTGAHVDSGFTNFEAYIIKFNSSGTILWQRWAGNTPLQFVPLGYGPASVSPSGDVYVTGDILPTANVSDRLVAAYNTNGVLQQARRVTGREPAYIGISVVGSSMFIGSSRGATRQPTSLALTGTSVTLPNEVAGSFTLFSHSINNVAAGQQIFPATDLAFSSNNRTFTFTRTVLT